ncbi:FliH/SctL family protein [Fervidibacter sacchari]|uniref:Flagellar biosynthesis/type III secretory pathway protein FliH n=1 Tax=Candidatus Fervidibacter sacchari TaxID=1448929 RepID=A0ABT2EN23_9BACT|nr:FliH/SctL family protein [Candidatus Fervidibacter sacchari]MCS3919354.1 flagellar biosynthesis/type III secretory pathway protein FliH [Candidatus Fervidibacter sacchari]WKU15090.1 FliH/SctL family protein [Candidatus Fervidibacter sacchari]
MPVLHQPLYIPKPVPWDEPETNSPPANCNPPSSEEDKSFQPDMPINQSGLVQMDYCQSPERRSNSDLSVQALLTQSTRTQSERAIAEAYQTGYQDGFAAGKQEGYQQGLAEAEQRFREQIERLHDYAHARLQAITEAIRNELRSFFTRAEEAVTQLAIEIAKKVIETEVKTNPEVVRNAVSQALNQLKGANITVRINPADFSLLGGDLSLVNLGEGVSVRFVPDETVEQGGVIAESEQGFVDLQPSTKLALLHSEVL